jgi:hypothetical protein
MLSNSHLEQGREFRGGKWEYSPMGDGVAGQYCWHQEIPPDEKVSRNTHFAYWVTDRKLWRCKRHRFFTDQRGYRSVARQLPG